LQLLYNRDGAATSYVQAHGEAQQTRATIVLLDAVISGTNKLIIRFKEGLDFSKYESALDFGRLHFRIPYPHSNGDGALNDLAR
jgi:hypothetical protein